MPPDIQKAFKVKPAHIVSFIVFLLVSISTFTAQVYAADAVWPSKTTYKYANVNGKKIFYREAGIQHKQTIVLLHELSVVFTQLPRIDPTYQVVIM
ncbi:hypothetical protein P4S63_22990 [Pseudoalteromonas sp. B193]